MRKHPDKKTIICSIEGCDKVGKTHLLMNLKEQYKDDDTIYIYEREPEEYNKPDFHDEKKINEWLYNINYNRYKKLLKLSKQYDVIIIRSLKIADLVYAQIYDREIVTEDIMKKLRKKFIIINHIIIFDSYLDYVKKCERKKYDILYKEKDYKTVIELFKQYSKELFNYGELFRISKIKYYTSSKNLYKDFMTYMDNITKILYNVNI